MKNLIYRISIKIINAFDKWLYFIGLRRRILFYDNTNWSEIQWDKFLNSRSLFKILYKTSTIKIEQVFEILSNVPDIEVTKENYKEVSFNNLILWELSKTGILAGLETPVLKEVNERELKYIKHYYYAVVKLLIGFKKILETYKPDTIILSQGLSPMTSPIVELSRRKKINIVATEGSFLKNYIFCDNATGIILNRHSASRLSGDWLFTNLFSTEDQQKFREFYENESSQKRKEHETNQLNSENINFKTSLNIKEDTKIALFIGQVYTDASIIADSPYFPDPIELIKRTKIFFENEDNWCLVIRLHPKEIDGKSWANNPLHGIGSPYHENNEGVSYNSITYRKLKECNIVDNDKIKIINGRDIDTKELMKIATFGITINSQAGFEMCLLEKPVVVCGDAFYARKGFTFDISHEKCLETMLKMAINKEKLDNQQIRRAEQFASHLFQSVLFNRNLVCETRRLINLLDNNCGSVLRKKLIKKYVK